MKKKFLAAAIGAMLIGGSAMAVEVAHGGKGDLLLAPMVMSGGGWSSELKVVNTSTVDSTVAKVVFHSPDNSIELLDFLIYLSPGDVWTGVVKTENGVTGVTSSDDSAILAAESNFCPNATGTVGFTPDKVKYSVPYTFAYVNIFESRMVRGLPTVAGTTGSPVVNKAAILAEYSRLCNANLAITALDTDNVLTGSVTMTNPDNGNLLSLPMTALANYDNARHLSVGRFTGFTTNTGFVTATKRMVEDALWSSDYVVPYNNAAGQFTFGTVTFPTKETFLGATNGSQYSPFPGGPVVGFAVRDESENLLTRVLTGCAVSPCPVLSTPTNSFVNELNVFQVATGAGATTSANVFTEGFTKGWVNMSIAAEASEVSGKTGAALAAGAFGAPALATVIQWNYTKGNSVIQGAWTYAASTFTPAP